MGDRMTVGDRGAPRPPTATRPLVRAALRRRSASGAVTAEAAAVLPVLVAVGIGLVWVVALAVAQVRLVDAARDVVRAVARGDVASQATGRASGEAPDGTRFEVRRTEGRVVVTATAEVRGPGGLFAFLPGVLLSATATTAEEPE